MAYAFQKLNLTRAYDSGVDALDIYNNSTFVLINMTPLLHSNHKLYIDVRLFSLFIPTYTDQYSSLTRRSDTRSASTATTSTHSFTFAPSI